MSRVTPDDGIKKRMQTNFNSTVNFKKNVRARLEQQIKAGHIEKPDRCEACGDIPFNRSEIHAHHKDYLWDMPNNVTWLCRDCHIAVHNNGLIIDLDTDNNEYNYSEWN